MKGRSQAYGSSDPAGPKESFDRCLAVAPSATSCLEDLSTLEAVEGSCQEMAGTSRRLIAAAPELDTAYGGLAEAL